MRAVLGALLGLLVCGACGCLLFTDSINVPPVVTIDGPPTVRRGPKHMFKAQLEKPEPDVRFEWRWDERCPASVEAAEVSGERVEGASGATALVGFGPDMAGSMVCVWVVARDGRGARSHAARELTVSEPVLTIEPPSGPLKSGVKVAFSVGYLDEPGRVAQFFGAEAPDCETARSLARAKLERARAAAMTAGATPALTMGPASIDVDIPRRSYCVVAVARDEYGVEAYSEKMMARPDTGELEVTLAAPALENAADPVPLFSFVRLSAGKPGAFDPDAPVTFQWKVTGPGGAALTSLDCKAAGPANVEFCLPASSTGAYQAEVTVMETTGPTVAKPLTFRVEDSPPCIRETSPSFQSGGRLYQLANEERYFEVREVADDGDPLPPPAHPTQSAFAWYIKRSDETEFRRLVNATYREHYIAPREHRPGDSIEVRVEYRDRVGLVEPARRSLAHCPPDQALCGVPAGGSCYQRVTWKVNFL